MLLFVIGTFNTYAGDAESVEISNGIIQLRSKGHKEFIFAIDEKNRNKWTNLDRHQLSYNLELYTNGCEKQYCLRIGVKNYRAKEVFGPSKFPAAYLPTYAKLLLKLNDDSVIESTSILNKLDKDKDHYGHFLLSESVLNSIFEGVKKIRIEIIKYDSKKEIIQNEFREVEYKEDKFGKHIKKDYENVNKEYTKKKKELLEKLKVSTMTNIHEGF